MHDLPVRVAMIAACNAPAMAAGMLYPVSPASTGAKRP
jgi:hypothetical protein